MVTWVTIREWFMRSLKRTGMVVLAAAAFSVPSAASALSIRGLGFHNILIGWSHQLTEHRGDWGRTRPYQKPRWQHHENPRDEKPCNPDQSVPEPTAALLFGVGAAVVAVRTRKRS